MNNQQENIHPTVSHKFHIGVRWNLVGSIIYELAKAIHNFFLFTIISRSAYGLLGSTFSIIYFASKLADLGAATSLPPFFHFFMKDKRTFRHIMVKHYLVPHLPILFGVAGLTTYLYAGQFQMAGRSCAVYLIPIIISLETMRYFLRLFLHAAFKSKHVVITEVALFFIYLSIIWTPHLVGNTPITLPHILIAHVVDSLTCVAIFSGMLVKYYQTLPEAPQPYRRPSIRRLTTTKLLNYTLRISRDLFTSNFLTPLLAIKCGLGPAGIFYFATILVTTIQSILKMSIHYPSNALLANLKESSYLAKREAFNLTVKKLMMLGIPFFIFLAINFRQLLAIGYQTSFTQTTLALSLVYLFIIFLDLFFILYEQFYVIEEASSRLLFFKLLEISLFYILVVAHGAQSPIILLTTVAGIKVLSFIITALHAFSRWHLIPAVKVNPRFIISWIFISLLFSRIF